MDPVYGARFAVKRLSDAALASSPAALSAARQSMRRELAVLQRLWHPHIIRLLGFSPPTAESPDMCLVFELGIHGSVADVLRHDGRATSFDWRSRVRALAGVASGLNYMHCSAKPPMFHRDVKSANIVLMQGMVAKLIDAGMARLLTPEQAEAHGAGTKSIFTMAGTGTLGAAVGGLVGTPGCVPARVRMRPRRRNCITSSPRQLRMRWQILHRFVLKRNQRISSSTPLLLCSALSS